VTNVIFFIDRHNISRFVGKVPNVTKFDASFFSINYKQAHIMDPMCRLLLERVYEAILDAG
jgi:fatty acid synthase